jgi:hypothetical protein
MIDERVQDNKDAQRRAYHRQYYHDKKKPGQCPYCELMFSSRSAVCASYEEECQMYPATDH